MYEFSRNGNILIMEKPSDLSYDMFFEKYWFIVSQKTDISKNYDYLNTMSEIWINYKFRNCIYDKDTIFKVKKMAKNINY
jgi:hypothetical protein